ncbi:MAG: hypothetical protein MJ186_02290 [Clostridia bacterium]|nr:hypothetical protein [Clostridia bacterium]
MNKKILAAVLALAMVMAAFTGCGSKTEEPEPQTGMPNPIREVGSLAEVNQEAGVDLVEPGVMGKTDESYAVIECGSYMLGEYRFNIGDVKYIFRGANVKDEDISGIYVAGNPAFAGDMEAIIATEEFRAGRWFKGDTQYVLCAEDGGKMDPQTFADIVEEISGMTGASYGTVDLSGFWADEVSQRANAEITEIGSSFHTVVRWGNSASETVVWELNLEFAGGNSFAYVDGIRKLEVTADDGTVEEIVEADDLSGEFTFDGEKLHWTGSSEAGDVENVFVKAE